MVVFTRNTFNTIRDNNENMNEGCIQSVDWTSGLKFGETKSQARALD